jgi:hypothetical protein
MAAAPETVRRLVDRFNAARKVFLSGDYKEEQLRAELGQRTCRLRFLNPFFTALGWDTDIPLTRFVPEIGEVSLFSLPKKGRRTLTTDNGFEHTRHEWITAAIGIHCYFCDPYSAWQRGANENRNGMVRRYFPKGTDFSRLTRAEIRRVELTINNRPMKCLGYRTPLEAASHFVALRR